MNSNTIKQGSKPSAPQQVLPAIFLMVALTVLYFLGVYVKPGLATRILSIFSLSVLLITALARVSDLTVNLTGTRWHVRRFGLVLAGAGAVALMTLPLTEDIYPSWREVMFQFGMALTWFTTPGMPPWWRFIASKDA